MKAIESTGHKQTIPEREAAARERYRVQLSCIAHGLYVLGEYSAARMAEEAKCAITPPAGASGTSEENQ